VKLKLAAVALLAAFLIALPYQVTFAKYDWRYDPAQYPKMAAWAGCRAQVIVTDDSPVTSYYNSLWHTLVIGGGEDSGVPYYAGLIILLHETGHCLQDQNGTLGDYGMDPVPYELDADRTAADLACSMGMDGAQMLRDTFDWAHEKFGYNGDPMHGSLDERKSQGDLAPHCMKKEVQSWASRSLR
jgi:hypothetical protein